jgi:hypothetical protein
MNNTQMALLTLGIRPRPPIIRTSEPCRIIAGEPDRELAGALAGAAAMRAKGARKIEEVHALLVQHGTLTPPDLVRMTGYSLSRIVTYLADLRDEGRVKSQRKGPVWHYTAIESMGRLA